MMLRIVSGACRRVGKTELSMHLARILPGAVCAKIGHNPRRKGKPAHYFTGVKGFFAFLRNLPRTRRHCVVESNLLALRDYGDVRIFIGAPPDALNVRRDAGLLSSKAHIKVLPNGSARGWTRVLRAKLADAKLASNIRSALEEQRRFISKPHT